MIVGASPFDHVWPQVNGHGVISDAVRTTIQRIEKVFGARFMYDSSTFPFGSELVDLSRLADRMEERAVIKDVYRIPSLADEPPIIQWGVECNTTRPHRTSGMSYHSDREALTAALAESLERYIWFEASDYCKGRFVSSVRDLNRSAIDPSQFAGFSPAQRAASPRLAISDSSEYLWMTAHSWTTKRQVLVPAQTVSAFESRARRAAHEPVIRPSITTGLATWPSKIGAVIRGALEIIERDAFMIMWLNQLSLPRIDSWELRQSHSAVNALLNMCEQYRLHVEFVHLITDAPAHAICAVVRDESSAGFPLTLGIKAHQSIAIAAEGALLEALRARSNARIRLTQGAVSPSGTHPIHHGWERPLYWSHEERRAQLDFLTKGESAPSPLHEPWENELDEKAYLQRLITWCNDKSYDLISVDMGKSAHNPTSWSIEMVIIPQLQPLHQDETYPCIGGTRITDIPSQFGYTARSTPFIDAPHPFV